MARARCTQASSFDGVHQHWSFDFLRAVVVTVVGLHADDAAALEPILAEASPMNAKDFVLPAEAFVDQFRQEVVATRGLRKRGENIELLCVLGLVASLMRFGLYDARARSLLRRVATHFSIPWSDVAQAEDVAFIHVCLPLIDTAAMPSAEDTSERCAGASCAPAVQCVCM
jgi:hypothetical protein